MLASDKERRAASIEFNQSINQSNRRRRVLVDKRELGQGREKRMKGGEKRRNGTTERRREKKLEIERVELDDDDALGIQTMLNKAQAKSQKPKAVPLETPCRARLTLTPHSGGVRINQNDILVLPIIRRIFFCCG